MKILFGLAFLSSIASAQLPDAPKPQLKAFALNVGIGERYSLTRSLHELSPQVGIDYRVGSRLRLGLSYSHTFAVNPSPNSGRQGNNILFNANYKLFQWGKAR